MLDWGRKWHRCPMIPGLIRSGRVRLATHLGFSRLTLHNCRQEEFRGFRFVYLVVKLEVLIGRSVFLTVILSCRRSGTGCPPSVRSILSDFGHVVLSGRSFRQTISFPHSLVFHVQVKLPGNRLIISRILLLNSNGALPSSRLPRFRYRRFSLRYPAPTHQETLSLC